VIDLEQSRFAFLINGACNQQYICMPNATYKQHSEALYIVAGRKAVEHLNIAVVA